MSIEKTIAKYYSKRDDLLDVLAQSGNLEQRALVVAKAAIINEILADLENLKRG